MILSNQEIRITNHANNTFLILFFGFVEQCFDCRDLCPSQSTPFPAAFAANVPPAPTSCGEREIVPYADVIIYRYRIENGRKQYRRWNETRGYWVDPYWLDVPGSK